MRLFSFLSLIALTFLFVPLAQAAVATSHIHGTSATSTLDGEATFEDTEGGLKITVNIHDAPPGQHGIHIHEKGSCYDSGQDAGGHFNPDGLPHGNALKDGVSKTHAGDLGNIEIGADGKGKLEVIVPGLKVAGDKFAVVDRAIILHEKEDDFGQPTGNAGGRIGCGVIA